MCFNKHPPLGVNATQAVFLGGGFAQSLAWLRIGVRRRELRHHQRKVGEQMRAE